MSLPVYEPTLLEKVQAFLSGLRMRLLPRKTLVVGPYAGEFGIEIIKFQGFVRALAPKYEKVYVITYPGREPMYSGDNITVHTHDFDLTTAGYWYGKRSFAELNEVATQFARTQGLEEFDVFNTNLLCTGLHRRMLWAQKHKPFKPSSKHGQLECDLVFHFRAIDKAGPDASRNYRSELAESLARSCVEKGWHCVCIGHPDYSLCFDGCEDRRTETLAETIAVLCSGKMLVGELSGPVHLAIYCDRPVVSWAPEPHRMQYARAHNPFHVKIQCVSETTTNPPPEQVVRTISECLAELS